MDAKRRRINELAGLGGVTDAALTAILNKLSADPTVLEAAASRWTIHGAVGQIMKDIGRTSTLTLQCGGSFEWHHACIRKLLPEFVSRHASFGDLFGNCGSSPLSLVFYSDEITPGNVLRPDNKRKVHAFYIAFKEFGPAHLCQEAAWLPLAVLRSCVAKRVAGGFSAVCRTLLGTIFGGPHCLQAAGVVLKLPEGPRLVFARLSNILGDEAALKAIWSSKGAAGLLPCFNCKNVALHSSELAGFDRGGYLVSIAHAAAESFDGASNTDHWEKHDMLARSRPVMTKKLFEEHEKAVGISLNPQGVLADVSLRAFVKPATVHTYDVMHVLFSNGICQLEFYLLLEHAKSKCGISYNHLRLFMGSAWEFAHVHKTRGAAVADLFSESRANASTETFKAGASEVLLVYPLFRHFVVKLLSPSVAMSGPVSSLLALCDVVDEVLRVKRGHGRRLALLIASIKKYLTVFVNTYSADLVRPKHHFLHHIPQQIERDGMLLDCWVHERKHQMVKRSCNWVDNTSQFEKSALARALNEQSRQLGEPSCFCTGLRAPFMLWPEAREVFGTAVMVSRALSHEGFLVHTGDVVLLQDEVFKVSVCVNADGLHYVVAVEYSRVEETKYALRCKLSERTRLLRVSSNMEHAACWSVEADGTVLVLR